VPVALVATATAASADRSAKVAAAFAQPELYETHPAVTYDQTSVPEGSRVKVVEWPNEKGGLNVTLRVRRLAPSRRYDAYVYTRPCGATPAAAGRRTQDAPRAEHCPQNEVWLNFKTNRRGDATARAAQYWIFEPGEANSVVIHSHTSKARVACVTVPFT
jgi:superoxide dismutase, Cu-Zn family